ncbi:MAG: winged helix-turn-helix domain-containing protein [Acidobacteria bacterium]|nr:winged helix-turn-helix domain-containing protein [Acidobacteriota bacterium]
MNTNTPTNVIAAFEMLLEEIETEIDFVNRIGARAFANRDLEGVRNAAERSAQFTNFRDNTDSLKQEWENLFSYEDDEGDSEEHSERRNLGRLKRGMRTPEKAYNRPILQTLQEMGGKGHMGEVLDKVLVKMKSTLKDVDYEPLASDPEGPRWKNAAQWARNTMVKNGMMRNDSPRGVWEITEKGKEFLRA